MRGKGWLGGMLIAAAASCLPYGLVKILDADAALLDSPASRYGLAACAVTLFVAATLSVGLSLGSWLLPARQRWEERWSFAFALGALAFQTGTFLLGLLGALDQIGALLMALALLALGARPGWRIARHAFKLPHGRTRSVWRMRGHALIAAVGAVTLALMGAHTLTTDSIGYDSSWYHLPVAEAYAATGAIRPFQDGWLLGSYPQMASLLYSWALAVTRESALGLTTAAFLELTFVAAAILGVVPVVRALLPGVRRANWAWAVVALFPAVYLYPPRVEADYLAAAFAAPLLTCAFKVWDDATPRCLTLGSLLLGGMLLVKYSALGACALPLLLAVAGVLRRLWRARKTRLVAELAHAGRALGIAAATFLAVTSTHWLKNLIFYGDALFPSRSPPSAFTPVTHAFYEAILKTLWIPAEGFEGWKETARAVLTFSFEPHEYPEHNPGHAIFGSLFSLTLPALVLLLPLGRARRALVAHVGTLLGVMIWYRIHHQDRYLLAMLPWMCAVTAATLHELARGNLPGRLLVLGTCLLQLAWGTRYAIKLFPLDGIRSTVWADSVTNWQNRQLGKWSVMHQVGRALKPGDVLLVHDERIRLGLRRASLSDALGFQTRISFADLGSDDRIFDELTRLGVTHLYRSSRNSGFDTLAGDLFYNAFFERHGRSTSIRSLRRMPSARPSGTPAAERLVFIDTCGALHIAPGLYRARELTDVTFGMARYLQTQPLALARTATEAATLEERAEFLVVADSCSSSKRVATTDGFHLMTNRVGYGLYLRRAEAP
jgi:hypothetical protein